MSVPVLLVRLAPWEEARWRAAAAAMRQTHPQARLVLLTSPAAAGAVPRALFDEIWQDGAPRGPLALLALMRRLSWASFAVIYDGQGGSRLRLYKFLVRPAPLWKRMAN